MRATSSSVPAKACIAVTAFWCKASARSMGLLGSRSQAAGGAAPPFAFPADVARALPELDGVIITHEHYDHCDLDALAGYRDPGVPVAVPQTVAAPARDHGFTDVRVLAPWQHTGIGGVTVTAAPGKHGVPEITYMLQGGGRTIHHTRPSARKGNHDEQDRSNFWHRTPGSRRTAAAGSPVAARSSRARPVLASTTAIIGRGGPAGRRAPGR